MVRGILFEKMRENAKEKNTEKKNERREKGKADQLKRDLSVGGELKSIERVKERI